MTHARLSSAALFAAITLSAGVALGQGAHVDATNSPSQNQSTNGPAGTYDMSTTRSAIAPDGAKTETTQSFDKSQSYTSGNGVLSAHTHIDTTGPTTTTINPPTSTMGATP